ncbi:MAG TPA: ABC transporter permease [Armatimonadota bacterium]|nr:ABC transporter permease [Armatimonadota bacterium]HQK93100.1 ABC transporter permease [Armatimonadota bacterium]
MSAPGDAEVLTPASTHRHDRPLRGVLSALLYGYMGLVLAVILANALWLGRDNPLTGESYLTSLFANTDLRGQVAFAFRLSLITSLITTMLAMVVGIPSAYALSRFRFRGMSVIDTVIDLPLVIPPLVAGIALLLFFRQSMAGRWFEQHVVPIVYTQRGIVVAQFFIASAFAIRALKAAFDQVTPRYESVARSLGCSAWQAMWIVALPLARNGIIAGAIMTWARAMGEFAPTMMVAGATPGRTDVLPVAAFLNMSAGNVEAAIAIVVLMIAIAAVTLVTFKRLGGQGYIW